MYNLKLIIFILCSVIFAGACSANIAEGNQLYASQKGASTVKMTKEATLNGKAYLSKDGRILVNGVTNLPDQTKLLVSIENSAVGFTAQDETKVANGLFSVGPLGPLSGVTPGNYLVEIVMPIPSAQPASVQTAVGEEGEYLTGPLVKDSMWGGKNVEYSFNYTVGSQHDIEKAESIHRKLVAEVRSAINDLLVTGKSMEKYRKAEALSALRTCGNMMRKNQAIANKVRKKADTLPLNYIDLKIASVEVISCLSCSDDALESCDRITELLKK